MALERHDLGESGSRAAPPAGRAAERELPLIVRTATALLSAQGLTWAASLVELMLVPRFLGARALGIFAAAYTVAMMLEAVGGFGTSNYIVKEVARRPLESASIVINSVIVRLGLWAAAIAVIVPAMLLLVEDRVVVAVLVAVFIGTAVRLIGSAMMSGLQGHHSLGRAAVAVAVITLLGEAATAAILFGGGRLIPVVYARLLFGTSMMLVTAYIYWSKFGGSVRWSPQATRTVIKAGVPFLAWDLALIIYGSVDTVMLAAMVGATTVGWYSLAYRLVSIPMFVPTIITAAVFPSLSSAARRDPEWFKRLLTEAVRVALIATVPMGVGLGLLAADIVHLIGGGEFERSAPLVMILGATIPVVAVDTLVGTGLFALDRQRAWATVAWAAALLNPALNLLAIPLTDAWWSNGAIGAAAVTGLTELLMAFWAWRLVGPSIDVRAVAGTAGRVIVASALMSVVVLLVSRSAGVAGAIPAGVAAYAAAAWALRLVSPADLAFVRSALLRGSRGTVAQPRP